MLYAFLAVVAVAGLAIAALVAAPLRSASPRLFAGIVVVVPLLLVTLYQLVGTPAALDPANARARELPRTLDQAITELEATLRRDPAQPEGWTLLGRSYTAQGRFAEARDAYATAVQQLPDEPNLLVEAAQSRAQVDPQKRFDDAALAMLRKAVAIDPVNQRAHWFIGVVQRQRGEDAAAVATWEALLPRLDAGTATALREQIAAARADAGMPPMAQVATAAPAAGLRVKLALDPDFAARARLPGDATVFVIARVPGGPPMPVAVERHALRDLPLDIVLDDGDSPMPTQKLSALSEVEVFARVSASGDATRQDGDPESAPVRVALPAKDPIDLVIGDDTP